MKTENITIEELVDHFEANDNADIFDTAANNVPVYGIARGVSQGIASLFGGGGPDLNRRQQDFKTYFAQGKVLDGDPKNDGTWVFNMDWLKANPQDAYTKAGSLGDQRLIKLFNDYKVSHGIAPTQSLAAVTMGQLPAPLAVRAGAPAQPQISDVPVTNNTPLSGAADLGGLKLFGNMSSTGIAVAVIGALAVVGLVIWLANK